MTLIVKNAAIGVDGQWLFSKLSFYVAKGETVSVMGPSGSGKSSLLNFISGNLNDSWVARGDLLLDGRSVSAVPAYRRRIGLQFQDHLLFPHMTVGENLAFGVPRVYTRGERQQKVLSALADCGLEGYKDHNPALLSGGQQARISLMRTLLSEPCLLLLDEPFSRLDTDLREQCREFVFNQIKIRGIPALMVTHDQQDIPDSGSVIDLKDYIPNLAV